MDLVRHLTYFVAVAEELHFGRAAARLHMAQPPLSQRIRGLERHLGVALFERSSRRVDLTPAGRLLLPEARELLARAERVESLAQRMRADEPAELHAAVIPAIAAPVLADAIARFARARPDVRLELRETPDDRQLADLAAGGLDVGLVRRPADVGRLHVAETLTAALGVLLSADAPAAAADEVELAALNGMELVLFERATAPMVYDQLLADCRAHGFAPPAVRLASGLQFTIGLVLAGGAVALSPQTEAPPGCAWRPLAGAPLQLAVSMVWREDAESDVLAVFQEVLVTAMLDRGWRRAGADEARRPHVRPASGLLS